MSSVLRRAMELLYEREKENFVGKRADFFVQISKTLGKDGPVIYQADFSYTPAKCLDGDFWMPDYLIEFDDFFQQEYHVPEGYHPKAYFHEDGYAKWDENGRITIYDEGNQVNRVSQNIYKGCYNRI